MTIMLTIQIPQDFTHTFSTFSNSTPFQEFSWDVVEFPLSLSLPPLSLSLPPLSYSSKSSFQDFSWTWEDSPSPFFSWDLPTSWKEDETSYNEIRLLGEGAFGQVILVEDDQGEKFAMKKCTLSKHDYNTHREAEIMRLLQGCENIVQLVKTIPNEDKDRYGVHLIIELCDGDLLSLIQKSGYEGLQEDVVKDLAQDMIKAIRFMRLRDVSHCDLKPENILFKIDLTRKSGYRFLIADFGNSERGDNIIEFYRIQTNHYRCGENLREQIMFEIGDDCKTDISSCDYGSLACILCEAITGEYLI
jgi:dual specificity protein kinase YAK1